MTTAVRPYPRKVKPTRREAPPPTPLSDNAAWLDACAAYWQAQPGVVLHWVRNRANTGYTGFWVTVVGQGTIATVGIFE
jgi:hypothetical protein